VPEPIDTDRSRLQAVLSGPEEPTVVALEARLRAAQLAADVGALDALISESLLFTGPDGQLATKADDLAAHRSGSVRILGHEPEALEIRRVGRDVAAVALRTALTVAVHGQVVMQGPVRYTRVWACEADGVWRVVAGHVSQVPAIAE